MKYPFIISILIFSLSFILSSCDSPTDSKATPVNTPALISPHDNDSGVTLTPIFLWSGAADVLQVSTNSAFSNCHNFGIVGTSFFMPSGILDSNNNYFWHVGSSSNGITYWSGTWSFRTIDH
ncbi:MAG: hypothetical protein ABSF32_08820 [Ignavibacteria bacterium]|jgi:hypothetical protein